MYTVRVDDSVLAEIVNRLVSATHPERIILFGSRARGDYKPDSDVDLLIIGDSDLPRHRRTVPAYDALWGLGIPKDIIWYTPAEVTEWSGVPNHVVTRALAEGRVLYEKRA